MLAFEACLVTSVPPDGDRKVPLPSAFGVRLRDDSKLFLDPSSCFGSIELFLNDTELFY